MTWKLRNIRPLTDDSYEVKFETEAGKVEYITCRVVTTRGVTTIQPKPDIFMHKGPPLANSREIAAAVIEFHKRRGKAIE